MLHGIAQAGPELYAERLPALAANLVQLADYRLAEDWLAVNVLGELAGVQAAGVMA